MKVETMIKVLKRDVKKYEFLADDAPSEDTKNFCLNRAKVYEAIIKELQRKE